MNLANAFEFFSQRPVRVSPLHPNIVLTGRATRNSPVEELANWLHVLSRRLLPSTALFSSWNMSRWELWRYFNRLYRHSNVQPAIKSRGCKLHEERIYVGNGRINRLVSRGSSLILLFLLYLDSAFFYQRLLAKAILHTLSYLSFYYSFIDESLLCLPCFWYRSSGRCTPFFFSS